MPIEQALDKIFNTPFRRRTTLEAGIGGAGLLALPSIARAQEGGTVAGVVAEAPAEAESSNLVEVTDILERPFEPKYEIIWPDGKSFTVINPEKGNKGFMMNPDKQLAIEMADPVTFETVIDSSTGQPKMRYTTLKDELKRLMDRYEVPEIVFEPNEEISTGVNKRFFSVGAGSTSSILDREPYMFFEPVVKPDNYLNALVIRYRFYIIPIFHEFAS